VLSSSEVGCNGIEVTGTPVSEQATEQEPLERMYLPVFDLFGRTSGRLQASDVNTLQAECPIDCPSGQVS
jgi:hypothetical protein